jgi:hypothetical protein
MSHKSIDQLKAAEAALNERRTAIRQQIKDREAKAMERLAKGYAKALRAAAKASGGTLPTPEQLAAMLTASEPSKAAPRRATARRKAKAEA